MFQKGCKCHFFCLEIMDAALKKPQSEIEPSYKKTKCSNIITTTVAKVVCTY